jgi:hypothetical protein
MKGNQLPSVDPTLTKIWDRHIRWQLIEEKITAIEIQNGSREGSITLDDSRGS